MYQPFKHIIIKYTGKYPRLQMLRLRYAIEKRQLKDVERSIRDEEFLIFCQTGKFPE